MIRRFVFVSELFQHYYPIIELDLKKTFSSNKFYLRRERTLNHWKVNWQCLSPQGPNGHQILVVDRQILMWCPCFLQRHVISLKWVCGSERVSHCSIKRKEMKRTSSCSEHSTNDNENEQSFSKEKSADVGWTVVRDYHLGQRFCFNTVSEVNIQWQMAWEKWKRSLIEPAGFLVSCSGSSFNNWLRLYMHHSTEIIFSSK